jgi:hypothetical protein
MEATVVVVALGAAAVVLVALGNRSEPERERVPVRLDDDDARPPIRRR